VKQWFADQIPLLDFDVYCAVLPSGWSVVKVQSDFDKGGLVAEYKNTLGYTLNLYEGSFCAMSPNPCTGYWDPVVGPIPFGPFTAPLDGASGHWSVLVHTSNPKVSYEMVGEGMDVAAMKSYAAALHKVG
jgi:hypothetical protein